jgi:hypothetical protein
MKLRLGAGRRRGGARAPARAKPPPLEVRGPFFEAVPIIGLPPPIPADWAAVLHSKHNNTGRTDAPSPRARPPRIRLQPELSDRQFLDRLRQAYLKQVHEARARPKHAPPARPFQGVAQELHAGAALLPALDLSTIERELFDEEEERILTYAEDPLNRLLDPELQNQSDSFETLSAREDSDGDQKGILHHHAGCSTATPEQDFESELFSSLSADDDAKDAGF